MSEEKEPPMTGIEADLWHAMRLGVAGTDEDRRMYLKRLALRYRKTRPELAANLRDLSERYPIKHKRRRREHFPAEVLEGAISHRGLTDE